MTPGFARCSIKALLVVSMLCIERCLDYVRFLLISRSNFSHIITQKLLCIESINKILFALKSIFK